MQPDAEFLNIDTYPKVIHSEDVEATRENKM